MTYSLAVSTFLNMQSLLMFMCVQAKHLAHTILQQLDLAYELYTIFLHVVYTSIEMK